MTRLPFVDEHHVVVQADTLRAYEAATDVVGRAFSGRRARLAAGLLSCPQVAREVDRPLVEGSVLCGFEVVRASPGEILSLEGAHRFSRYRLTIRIERLGERKSVVKAQTSAVFTRTTGRIYRMLVVDSHVHAIFVRRMLSYIDLRARRLTASSPR